MRFSSIKHTHIVVANIVIHFWNSKLAKRNLYTCETVSPLSPLPASLVSKLASEDTQEFITTPPGCLGRSRQREG